MNLCLCIHRLFHISQKRKSSHYHYREISGFREMHFFYLLRARLYTNKELGIGKKSVLQHKLYSTVFRTNCNDYS